MMSETAKQTKTCLFDQEPCHQSYCLKGNCIELENYESDSRDADPDPDDYFCEAYWDGDQWICPIAGTEDCDWECTAPPGAFSEPPGGAA